VEEPIWLTAQLVELIHLEQVAEHGGRRGIRDANALESAVARRQQRLTYHADATLPQLAAALCYGLVRDHPFIGGNKRVGFLAAYTFLAINGLELQAGEDDTVSTIEAVAAGSASEADLAQWLAANSQPSG
jgi:death-on-curing protein